MWNTVFYQPMHAALAFFISALGGDVGLAIIALTILVRLVLFPLSKKSILSQRRMKELEPELKQIKEKYKNDKQEYARRTMEIYRANKVNPFSSILLILIQLPIIIVLYQVFLRLPLEPAPMLLGLVDLSGKSLFLAVLVGISQFFQTKLMTQPSAPSDPNSFGGQLSRSFQLQMKYFLPFFLAFIAYKFSAAVALYLLVSNMLTIGKELYLKKKPPNEPGNYQKPN